MIREKGLKWANELFQSFEKDRKSFQRGANDKIVKFYEEWIADSEEKYRTKLTEFNNKYRETLQRYSFLQEILRRINKDILCD